MAHSYEIDRTLYGLPCGPDDPAYTADKWPLSKAIAHFKESTKAFGPQVADLFAASVGEGGDISRIAASGYPSALVEAVGDFDILGSFKRYAHDSNLKRVSAHGMHPVYQDTQQGRDLALVDRENGLEFYYAGQMDVVYRLWWAMLCENSAPFAALHGWIARVLQARKPGLSQEPSSAAKSN